MRSRSRARGPDDGISDQSNQIEWLSALGTFLIARGKLEDVRAYFDEMMSSESPIGSQLQGVPEWQRGRRLGCRCNAKIRVQAVNSRSRVRCQQNLRECRSRKGRESGANFFVRHKSKLPSRVLPGCYCERTKSDLDISTTLCFRKEAVICRFRLCNSVLLSFLHEA